MSQIFVERVIGLLATDEHMRERFGTDPRGAIEELVRRGMELTESERRSIAALDPEELARFVRAIDPRLQRAQLAGGAS